MGSGEDGERGVKRGRVKEKGERASGRERGSLELHYHQGKRHLKGVWEKTTSSNGKYCINATYSPVVRKINAQTHPHTHAHTCLINPVRSNHYSSTLQITVHPNTHTRTKSSFASVDSRELEHGVGTACVLMAAV